MRLKLFLPGLFSGRWGQAFCGTAADPDAVQWVDYNHDQYGRLDQVASSDFPAPTTVTYTYHPESDWLHTTTFPNGLTTTREPEEHRNLVDTVRNNLAGTTVSEYDYTNDAAARRTDVVMTGTAFNQNTFNAYDYNQNS